MNKVIKVIKVLLNILMTLIIIVGSIFIALYIFGIEPFVVESGSMEPTIHTGSLSFVNKHVKYENIKEYDVIAFKISTGARATHRVINITEKGLETKGDANENPDATLITKDTYIGKNIFSIPKVGYAVKLIQTTRGRIILITFIIVILLSGFLLDDKKQGKRFKEE